MVHLEFYFLSFFAGFAGDTWKFETWKCVQDQPPAVVCLRWTAGTVS